MFGKLRRARADLALMNRLLPAAEQLALAEGAERPGAEHLLLAALELDDGVARAALAAAGIAPADLRTAIVAVHAEALESVNVAADDDAIGAALPPPRVARGAYQSEGSLQTLFQAAVRSAKAEGRELCSGDILMAAVEAERGTPARALARLGLDRAALASLGGGSRA